MNRSIFRLLLLALTAGLGWMVYDRLQETRAPATQRAKGGPKPVPVESAPVRTGPIELRRTFSGTLEATAEFIVAPKVSGQVKQIAVDLADPVNRNQVVARLDDAEYQQAIAQAEADRAVEQANLTEAESALTIARRDLDRIQRLQGRGVSSESDLDAAKMEELARRAGVEVARAQVARADAALQSARIRSDYTRVEAGWNGGNEQRIVAERYVDEGETVSANTPLLRIVELDPVTGVIFVTEKDYAYLKPEQPALLRTDAYPGEDFPAEIARIAPVFQQGSRQARVELRVENPEQRLKPGLFVRVTVTLASIDDATLIPEVALTRRDDRDGIFLLADGGDTVRWLPVAVGIRQGETVQALGEGISGRVVTLGQQLLEDGSQVLLPGASE